MNGKLPVCVGRVVKAKKGIMQQYNGLLRIVNEDGGYFTCRNEHGNIVVTKSNGKEVPRVFHSDDLMVVK